MITEKVVVPTSEKEPIIKIACESYVDCGVEIAELAATHNSELVPYDGQFPYAPNLQAYQTLDDAGVLYIATVRVNGELVGYLLAVIIPQHLHYSIKWASGDGMYLRKDWRRPRIANRFLDFVESGLRSRGVILSTIGVSPANLAFGRLLENRGYKHSGTTWARRL
jgi:GNAT superfamily N-acetyltransferase